MRKENDSLATMQRRQITRMKRRMGEMETSLDHLEEQMHTFNTEREQRCEDILRDIDIHDNINDNYNNDNDNATMEEMPLDEDERLDSMEIKGIPHVEEENKLPQIVCDILQQIDVPAKVDDLLVCYQLHATTPNNNNSNNNNSKKTKDKKSKKQRDVVTTVCRFSDLDICRLAHRNKKMLRRVNVDGVDSGKLFINDHLCPSYKRLAARCRRLKKEKRVANTWTFKGIVKVRLFDGTVRSVKRDEDLDDLFDTNTSSVVVGSLNKDGDHQRDLFVTDTSSIVVTFLNKDADLSDTPTDSSFSDCVEND